MEKKRKQKSQCKLNYEKLIARLTKEGRIAKAQGEADGFNAILEGYVNSPDVTKKRLYLESMEQILPGIKKFILDDSSVLPFLPIDGATGGGVQ